MLKMRPASMSLRRDGRDESAVSWFGIFGMTACRQGENLPIAARREEICVATRCVAAEF